MPLKFALLALLALVSFARAGLYTPDDPCPFPIKADGTAEALPFGQVASLLVDRLAPRVPVDPVNPGTFDWRYEGDDGVMRSNYAGKIRQALETRWPKASELKGTDLAGLTAAMIRLEAYEAAFRLLQPELRARQPNPFLIANLVHFHVARGEIEAALTRMEAFEPEDKLPELPGTSPIQLKWQFGLETGIYRTWLKAQIAEAKAKLPASQLEPDALYVDGSGKTIGFWAGETERAKLPADAIAQVQQLLLWSPWDAKLLWTLAELYVAQGKVVEAHSTYELLINGRKFTGPSLLKENRAKTLESYEKLPKEVPAAIPLAGPPADGGLFALVDPMLFFIVLGVFIAAMTAMITLQILSIRKQIGSRFPKKS